MRAFLAILFFSWMFTLFLPWWTLFIPALFFGAWLTDKSSDAFLAGFAGSGMAWFLHALFIHIANDAILSTRIAEMLGAGSPWIVLLFTLIVGGIPGGLGALTGCLLKINLKM
jgi:hypothetical protein